MEPLKAVLQPPERLKVRRAARRYACRRISETIAESAAAQHCAMVGVEIRAAPRIFVMFVR